MSSVFFLVLATARVLPLFRLHVYVPWHINANFNNSNDKINAECFGAQESERECRVNNLDCRRPIVDDNDFVACSFEWFLSFLVASERSTLNFKLTRAVTALV
jgi:hypothetical protein